MINIKYTITDGCNIVDEKCIKHKSGDYIGVETGNVYSKNKFNHKTIYKAKIITIDNKNKTGMYHLNSDWSKNSEENKKSWKEKFVGGIVRIQKAHWAGDKIIYYCIDLKEYFSEDEIEIIKEEH